MHVQLKVVLDCPPEAAWEAIRSPAALADVSFPFLGFDPLEPDGFPERWPEGDHPVRLRGLFGLVPAGRQVISVSFSERSGARIMEDAGHATAGPLTVIRRWRHRLAVSPAPGGRTLYRDRLDFSAGPLTPLVWPALWAFWQWRAVGMRRLARTWATQFGGGNTGDGASIR